MKLEKGVLSRFIDEKYQEIYEEIKNKIEENGITEKVMIIKGSYPPYCSWQEKKILMKDYEVWKDKYVRNALSYKRIEEIDFYIKKEIAKYEEKINQLFLF